MIMKTNTQIAMHVSAVSIAVNIVLTALKLLAGIFAHSAAMVSDAVHSASDVFSTFVVIIGVRLSDKKSDADHPYGHERLECVAAIILAMMLFVTGAGIGADGIQRIFSKTALTIPGMAALAAAVLSIVVKEAMYWYTRAAGKKIHSGALMADAWHHRSDALSSIGSFAGILGARIGFPVLDSVASVIICLFIFKVAIDIFRDAIGKMTDKACDTETIAQVETLILAQAGVRGIDVLKTRLFGDKIYIDVEIRADADLPLIEAHAIAEQVHDTIEGEVQNVKHCMVHVNPCNTQEEV